MMAWSSSARNPMDRTRSTPSPTTRSRGTIFLSRASTSPRMPSSRGTENPQMSASSTPTVSPRRARATARLTVTELLPTPPLPEATAITRAVSGTSVTGASSRARSRARAMTACFCAASITPVVTVTCSTPSSAPTWVSTSRWIWVRNGQPAMVSATSTATRPPSTRTEVTMPRSTMSAPNSGSITLRRADRTAASVGATPVVSGVSGLVTAPIVVGVASGHSGPVYRRGPVPGTIVGDPPGRRTGW